jgi:glycosyltransferase involved in cell wall biosynthesis
LRCAEIREWIATRLFAPDLEVVTRPIDCSRMTTPSAEEVESPLARSADDASTLAFTVVVPTYGRPEGLRACLESLAAQQYPRSRFEVIVIDDGSAIPAAPIAASYDDRLQIRVRRQANAGPAAARNHGGMSARGSYIAFLDDDCVTEPGWLRGFESAFLAHPRDTLLGGDLANPFTDNVYAEVGELILDVLLACYRPEPGGVYFFRTANLAVRADEFRASGGFDPTFETAEDREFCDRWLDRGGQLLRVPPAAATHVSPLDLRGFVLRHFRYGRGAYRFHRLRRHRGSGRFRLQFLWFYLFVLQACLASKRQLLRKAALVFLWQACNVAGFVAAFLSERRGAATHQYAS